MGDHQGNTGRMTLAEIDALVMRLRSTPVDEISEDDQRAMLEVSASAMRDEEPIMGEEPKPIHAVIHISCQALRQMLLLYEEFEIVGVTMNTYQPGVIDLEIKYGDVPILPEGAELPLITPLYRQETRDGRKWYTLEAVRMDGDDAKVRDA